MDTAAPGERRIVGGRYTLLSTLGTGGMGTVWRGHDEILRRPVAVKEVTLPRGLPEQERDMLCERTLREARAAAALNHPAVIRVYDVVEDDGRPWIVMELLEARSLADIVHAEGPLDPRRVANIGLALLGALETAHTAGVLHRDVKPGNVLVGADGRTTLTDFGVARSPGESPLTSTGLLLGSPQYIAPERARGQAFGPVSDLWSLGATLYAAVEGRAPFDHGDPLPTMTAIVSDPPAPMTLAGPLAPVLTGLLTKEPAERFDHARTRAGLAAVLRTPPPVVHDTVPLVRPPVQVPADHLWQVATHTAPSPVARHRAAIVAGIVAVALLLGLGLVGLTTLLTGGTPDPGSPGPQRAQVAADRQRYAHPDGFTVEVPSDWDARAETPIRVYAPDKQVWIQLYTQPVSSGDPQAVWEAADRTNRANGRNPGYTLVGITPTQAAEHTASDWEWTYQRDGESERRRVLDRGVVVDGRSYQFALSAPESEFDRYRDVVAAVADSFRLSATP
ncbi:MAG TPA: serine/threonine-protein kinase [Mycobacteriales bacterium]|nr:serine/threonine-protein kinase [Mycobacteriales bacterium]